MVVGDDDEDDDEGGGGGHSASGSGGGSGEDLGGGVLGMVRRSSFNIFESVASAAEAAAEAADDALGAVQVTDDDDDDDEDGWEGPQAVSPTELKKEGQPAGNDTGVAAVVDTEGSLQEPEENRSAAAAAAADSAPVGTGESREKAERGEAEGAEQGEAEKQTEQDKEEEKRQKENAAEAELLAAEAEELAAEAKAVAEEAAALLGEKANPKEAPMKLHSLVLEGLGSTAELACVRERFAVKALKVSEKALKAKAGSSSSAMVGDQGPELDKNGFKALVKEICKMSFEGGAPFDRTENMPKEKDLDVAFIVADEDKSGGVDVEEFLNLYKMMKKGQIAGLGSMNSLKAREQKRTFKQQVATQRDTERQVTLALAAAAADQAKNQEILGNQYKSEAQIKAERDLAIKVGRLVTLRESELKRALLEEGFKFKDIRGKTADQCRLMLSTQWTAQVREIGRPQKVKSSPKKPSKAKSRALNNDSNGGVKLADATKQGGGEGGGEGTEKSGALSPGQTLPSSTAPPNQQEGDEVKDGEAGESSGSEYETDSDGDDNEKEAESKNPIEGFLGFLTSAAAGLF